MVIVDSSSTIMSAQRLIQKIQENNPNQKIILTTAEKEQDKLLSFYALNISTLQMKPFKTTILELKNSGYHVIVDDFGTDKLILVCLS